MVVGIVVRTVLFVVMMVVAASLCHLSSRIMRRPHFANGEVSAGLAVYAGLAGGGSYGYGGGGGCSLDYFALACARRFSWEVLSEATNSFSEERLLGEEGKFGAFYKGDLTDLGIPVAAVKWLKIKSEPAFAEGNYIKKLATISREGHRNIVPFLGWSSEQENLCLVYEFFKNGSLHDHLYNPERLLTWPMRYNIVLAIGSGLARLHEHLRPFLHGNIKPSNVRLDEEMNAKLGDFGLPQHFFQHDDEAASSSYPKILAASQGYVDPEFFLMEEATTSSDIYSFGVVLLEIACGQPPIILQQDQAEANSLVEFVWEPHEKGSIIEAADKRLNGEFNREEMARVLLVGLWCAHPDRFQRPSISEAMSLLKLDFHHGCQFLCQQLQMKAAHRQVVHHEPASL